MSAGFLVTLVSFVMLSDQYGWKVTYGLHPLVPPTLPVPMLEVKRSDDFEYYKPVDTELCWAANLACTPDTLLNVGLRCPECEIGGGCEHR